MMHNRQNNDPEGNFPNLVSVFQSLQSNCP